MTIVNAIAKWHSRRNEFRLFRFFLCKKSVIRSTVSPLRKKSRSAQLFAYKCAHTASLSLPTFCGLGCVFSMFVEWGNKTGSFRPPFSKGGGFLRQSLKPLSADSGTLLTKRSFEGLGELFSRRKVPLNCMQNAIYLHKICRWHIL